MQAMPDSVIACHCMLVKTLLPLVSMDSRSQSFGDSAVLARLLRALPTLLIDCMRRRTPKRILTVQHDLRINE